MRFLTGLVIIIGLSLGVWQIYKYWGHFKEQPVATAPAAQEMPEDQLPGMAPSLQPYLDAARQRGAVGLRDFLTTYAQQVNDPRRAAIELDYVVLVTPSDPTEARRVFAKVAARLHPDSPVFNRMKQLQKTYGENP